MNQEKACDYELKILACKPYFVSNFLESSTSNLMSLTLNTKMKTLDDTVSKSFSAITFYYYL